MRMRLQHVFDANWRHFVTEAKPPGYDFRSERCKYFTRDAAGNPLRCAIGVCFPPEWNEATLEGMGYLYVRELAQHVKAVSRLFDDMDDTPLVELQRLHDDCAHKSAEGADFTKIYKRALLGFAEKWHLEVPESELLAAA